MAVKIQGTTVIDNDRSIKNAQTVYQDITGNGSFWGNASTVTTEVTLENSHNHMSIGPVIVSDTGTITVEENASWVIV